jgi:type I restriction enzyme, S subunit
MKYRLGDICSIIKGETGIMKAIPGPFTMIALGEANKTHNEFQFDTKAVIIPLVSSTGHGHASMKRVKYFEGKFALGNILCAVIPKDEKFVLAKYLHIYLHWNREELLVSQMKGMANVSLPLNRIADVMVIVPSIEKQIEIVELEKQLVEKELKADKLFAEQLTQIETLNQAILREAVQGKLVKQDKKDEPASELLKRIKAEKGKSDKKEKSLPPIKPEEIPFNIPENWVWCRLGEISEIKRGKGPKYSEKGIFKMLNQKCIRWYEVDLQFCKSIDEDWSKSVPNDFKVSVNDVLVNSTGDGTIGRSAIAHKEVEGYIFDSHILKVSSKICQSYICYFINSTYGQEQVNKSKGATSTKQHELGVNNLSNFTFPLPPLSEQKRIVSEIEKQLAKTKQLKEHIIANQKAIEQLLKALLHQAFEIEEMEEV